MIKQLTEWAPLIALVWTYIGLFLKLIELLKKVEEIVELIKKLPRLLKLIGKFLIYSLSLAIPNVMIIWYFFYLAGISPDRLSEIEFFWAVVAQPTIFVSIYAYVWGKWIYPRLQRLLKGSKSRPEPRRNSRASNEPSGSGGKK